MAHATRDSVEQQGEQVKGIAEETERIGANLAAADIHVRCGLCVVLEGSGSGIP